MASAYQTQKLKTQKHTLSFRSHWSGPCILVYVGGRMQDPFDDSACGGTSCEAGQTPVAFPIWCDRDLGHGFRRSPGEHLFQAPEPKSRAGSLGQPDNDSRQSLLSFRDMIQSCVVFRERAFRNSAHTHCSGWGTSLDVIQGSCSNAPFDRKGLDVFINLVVTFFLWKRSRNDTIMLPRTSGG